MKKILSLVLALAMLLSCCAFASADDVKTYKVGVSISQYTDNFLTLYRNDIDAFGFVEPYGICCCICRTTVSNAKVPI